jgi:Fe-S-cluster containining protein
VERLRGNISVMRKFSLSPLRRPEIEQIWIAAAAEIGFRVERADTSYASSDGLGRIFIATDDHLDADDALAQLVFHELCHALCEGPERARLPDWGLDNSGAEPGHVVREHACLRLQTHLARPFGLRDLMAPTTEYRGYHDRLPADALADDDDPAVPLARLAAARADASPWREAIARAMALTAKALEHPLGFLVGRAEESCETCAWRYLGGRGKAVPRCRQSAQADGVGRRIQGDWPACDRWEAPVDCHACGACCREAYHSVTVSMRDPVVWRQPALVVRHGHRFEIRREGARCAALLAEESAPGSDGAPQAPRDSGGPRRFSCSIYADRPQACRDFEAGGRHCLDARRRVGLSRA